jgi:uncharacterized protein (DUF885 family)
MNPGQVRKPGGRKRKMMWKPAAAAILCLVVLPAIAPADTPGETASSRLNGLMEAFFEASLERYPLWATSIGDHRYDDRYTVSIAPDFRAEELERHRRYLEAVRQIDPDLLDEEDRVSRGVFLWDRGMDLEGLSFPSHLMPMTQFWSAANSFVQLGSGSSYHPFSTVRDYDNWLSRIDGFVDWVDQAIENMRQGMDQGVVLPGVLVQKMIPQVAGEVVDSPEESVFFQPVVNMPESFPTADRERLEKAFRAADRDQLIPAYRRLAEFLREEYLPASRETAGYGSLPNGERWYAYLVRRHTSTDLSPEEVHAIGLAEVERILGEMRAVMSRVGFEGDLHEFFDYMKSEPRFYFDRPEDLLDGYRALRERAHAGARPLFHTFPRLDYEIRPVEAFREKSAASGQYRPPDPQGTRKGVFFVNTYDLSARPSWAMESLFLHEAVPGHHFQGALRLENETVPSYRRFGWYTVYSEGWALYAESLGPAMGMYSDPDQYFGALSSELWRAIRLVVDTGIHRYGWTREQVLDYMYANAAVQEARAVAETERFMAIPGQALSYKVGELGIREMRAKAEVALGENFDIRDFHAVVLDGGPLPLAVLQARVERWIAAERDGAPGS